MLALLIIGIICLVGCYPLFRVLERQGSRWSNLVLAIGIIVGIVCIGVFAFI